MFCFVLFFLINQHLNVGFVFIQICKNQAALLNFVHIIQSYIKYSPGMSIREFGSSVYYS